MKKNILLSLCMVMAVTAVMTSCKKDHDFISIRATISDYRDTGKDGKTYIETINDGDNHVDWVSWNNNDKVWINNTAYNVTVSNEGTSNRYATFDRVTYVDPDHPETDGDGYYAVYPASQVVSSTFNGFPQILLPQVQIYRTDGADKNHGNQIIDAPMAAYCQASTTHVGLNFTNLCSLLKIDLSNMGMDATTEVAYITVSSSNKPLWGIATISSGTDGPTLSSPSLPNDFATSDNTVTLDFTDNGSHGSDGNSTSTGSSSAAAHGVTSRGPFYVVLPPTSGVAGLTINIYVFAGNNDAQSRRTILKYTKSRTSNISIVNNNIYTTGDLSTLDDDPVSDVPFPKLSSGEFSVAGTGTTSSNYRSTKKVRFALGNLQYNAATNTWRIAENQWDRLGSNNSNISQTYNGWIDLFGYGTSGVTYKPWLALSGYNYRSRYAQGNIINTDNDWGVNPISNGGNQPNKWRTLTSAEFLHLFNNRGGREGNGWSGYMVAERLHHTGVTVHGVKGMILLPDDFPYNDSPYNSDSYWDNITDTRWADLESRGAVFFPVTGQRNGTNVSGYSNNSSPTGYYWSSTCDESYDRTKPYALRFTSSGETSDATYYNYYGNAVRLVRDVN